MTAPPRAAPCGRSSPATSRISTARRSWPRPASRSPQTLAIRAARARGETGAALVTEDQIDAFALAGSPDHARRRLEAWLEAGLDTPIALPAGEADPVEQLRLIATELLPSLVARP